MLSVLVLALGIGSNTVIFNIVNAVLLRPLPFPDEERLVLMLAKDAKSGRLFEISFPDFLDWQAQSESFEAMTAMSADRWAFFVRKASGEPHPVNASLVAASFFEMLEVTPEHGRTFRPEEDDRGADRVVVLSHGLWRRHFGGDPES